LGTEFGNFFGLFGIAWNEIIGGDGIAVGIWNSWEVFLEKFESFK
jgi:hypothetical protein